MPQNKINEFKKKYDAPISYVSVDISERKVSNFDTLISQRVVSGYGVIWGAINGHGEKFVKGAFSKSISDMGPNSQSSYKIKFRDRHGKSVSLFAELTEDDIGLLFKSVPLDNVQWADDLLVQIRSGTINNFSVGFKHIWDKVEWDDEDDTLVILEARLFEISAVDVPSDLETYTIRGVQNEDDFMKYVEDFIENLQVQKRLQARHIISRCMSLKEKEPLDARQRALENDKPTKYGIDYNNIIKRLNFKL